MKIKICTKCQKKKKINKFPFRKVGSVDGYHNWCKECCKVYNKRYYKNNKSVINKQHKRYYQEHKRESKEYKKKYYLDNKERISKYGKKYKNINKEKIKKTYLKWYQKNKENILIKSKEYYEIHKKKILKKVKNYYKKNRKKVIEYNVKYRNKRRKSDIGIRLRDRLSKHIWDALKDNCKSNKTSVLIGCSIPKLKKHLEKQFKQGMNWNNYGKWHVDHIKPCASYDLSKPEEQRKCFHYTNLQPLWAEENFRKGNKIINE